MLSQAGLAQLVERAIRNRKVIGSTPIAGSTSILLILSQLSNFHRPRARATPFQFVTRLRRRILFAAVLALSVHQISG